MQSLESVELSNNKIICGDALTELKNLESESVDCCVTSPPYWALRDYKTEGQIGRETTIQEYIDKLTSIFLEVKRVLKKTGSCWIVIGDTYSKEKSLCMIPSRFAISMIDNGWILRNDIIWYKRNAMPSSAKDRFTVDYEHVFFFTKSQKYYFETQYEPHNPKYESRYKSKFGGTHKRNGQERLNKSGQGAFDYSKERYMTPNPFGRIKRSVWDIPTAIYRGAHFAVFPEKLIQPMVKAGCPELVCNNCGTPREKIIQKQYAKPKSNPYCTADDLRRIKHYEGNNFCNRRLGRAIIVGESIKGYNECKCNAGFHSGIVLDPFTGSGTTGFVALDNARQFIGIEINKEYVDIAEARLKTVNGKLQG